MYVKKSKQNVSHKKSYVSVCMFLKFFAPFSGQMIQLSWCI